jgi:peptidyl-prolyl cis-trans isomerase C
MNIRHLAGAAFCAAALAVSAAAPAQTAKETPKAEAKSALKPGVIATVNGVAIPQRRADVLLRERAAHGASPDDQLRAAVREDLVNREVIEQEAKRQGFTKSPELQAELDLVRQTVIVQNYVRDWLSKHPVTEDEMKQEYDKAKGTTGETEYKARHILVDSEDEAKTIIAELKKGGKFEDLAARSKDAGSKAKGGELGWGVPAYYDKAFADALVKLKKGEITQTPVHTRFGYHVIQLEDMRPVKFPSYEEVKPRLQQELSQRKLEQLVRDLRAKAKVVE